MGEWWSYSLSDFLLFSPRAYHRLLELHNAAVWPAQLLTMAFGIAVAVLPFRDHRWSGRGTAVGLAALWLWVGWAFLVERYTTINWAAPWLGLAFVIQSVLLLAVGLIPGTRPFRARPGPVGYMGLAILLFALVAQPLIGPAVGRPLAQVELFGVAPDPTVAATLGLLILTAMGWPLLVIPLLWCAVTGATLWTMGEPDALVMPVVAALAIAGTTWRMRQRQRGGAR